jgi:hypothetical protein
VAQPRFDAVQCVARRALLRLHRDDVLEAVSERPQFPAFPARFDERFDVDLEGRAGDLHRRLPEHLPYADRKAATDQVAC